MGAMIRKQVYIEPAQDHFLKQRADELGVTEADLIRQGINLLSQTPSCHATDADAWADEEAVLEARARLSPQRPDGWHFRRDEVYEDRPGRVSG